MVLMVPEETNVKHCDFRTANRNHVARFSEQCHHRDTIQKDSETLRGSGDRMLFKTGLSP